MRAFFRFYTLLEGLFLLGLMACGSNDKPADNTAEALPETTLSTDFEAFVQATRQAEAGQAIPFALCETYLAPALAFDSLYPFLDTSVAAYQYGEIVYEDSSLVVLSFYYKALNQRDLLAASFLASYARISGQCLGLRPIFSSSTFDKSQSKGYQLGLSCQSAIRYVEDGGPGILRLYSTVKYFYTAFEKEAARRENEQVKQVHLLEPSGRFVTVQGF
jgi:hypothetical protein